MDDCTWVNIGSSRVTGGTGHFMYFDGQAGNGNRYVHGNTFTQVHGGAQDGTVTILSDGAKARQNRIFGVTGVDHAPSITVSNSSQLYFDYYGTGYVATEVAEGAYSRVPPLKIIGYDNADANTLDWYIEGSGTATVQTGGSAAGATQTNTTMKFTRIGNVCHVYLSVALTTKPSTAGTVTIVLSGTNLPDASADGNHPLTIRPGGGFTANILDRPVHAILGGSSKTITLLKTVAGATAPAVLDRADIGDTMSLQIEGIFRVA
jgi:hypothetical protein